jgi:hypothetical protein
LALALGSTSALWPASVRSKVSICGTLTAAVLAPVGIATVGVVPVDTNASDSSCRAWVATCSGATIGWTKVGRGKPTTASVVVVVLVANGVSAGFVARAAGEGAAAEGVARGSVVDGWLAASEGFASARPVDDRFVPRRSTGGSCS